MATLRIQRKPAKQRSAAGLITIRYPEEGVRRARQMMLSAEPGAWGAFFVDDRGAGRFEDLTECAVDGFIPARDLALAALSRELTKIVLVRRVALMSDPSMQASA